ncbi:MAG TPA: hypothetical protein VK116_12950 [Planctomycetota bacterium]|nr:hypothetical protein [Planctomycetota bacterium]
MKNRREVAPNPYLDLTREFNAGRLRAILSSGQAVVLHRLAVMSKDGDWIVREEEESLAQIRGALARRGARYRFGAPLDVRWLRGGWSSHLELDADGLRIRTDFVSRPPRISAERLAAIWKEEESAEIPFVSAADLARIKMTRREKDWAVIGELARRLDDVRDQLLFSRSARDLERLGAVNPELVAELVSERPLLGELDRGRDALEAALDAERRSLMRADELRLRKYADASKTWAERWRSAQRELEGLSLEHAHARMVGWADGVLPFEPEV